MVAPVDVGKRHGRGQQRVLFAVGSVVARPSACGVIVNGNYCSVNRRAHVPRNYFRHRKKLDRIEALGCLDICDLVCRYTLSCRWLFTAYVIGSFNGLFRGLFRQCLDSGSYAYHLQPCQSILLDFPLPRKDFFLPHRRLVFPCREFMVGVECLGLGEGEVS